MSTNDNAQAGGGTPGSGTQAAVSPAITPELQAQINNSINAALSNRDRRINKQLEELKATVTSGLTGEALTKAVEASILKMAGDDPGAGNGQQAGGQSAQTQQGNPAQQGNGAGAQDDPRYKELLKRLEESDKRTKALERSLAEKDKQSAAAIEEAKYARVSAHVKGEILKLVGRDNAGVADLLTKELVRDRKLVDEAEGGGFVWKSKVPDGAGGFYEDPKPFSEGLTAWKAGEGKQFIPAQAPRLPNAGGYPFAPPGNQGGAGGNGNGQQGKGRMAGVLSQMHRDIARSAGEPGGGDDGNGSSGST